MKSKGMIPVPVLVLETIGILLLGVAWLSANQYVALPGIFAGKDAAVVMVFAGVALMIPAAIALILAMSRRVAPLLMLGVNTKPDKGKKDDANH